MKTLTVTEARKNLSGWLRRAKAGEEIGIIDGNQIVALRPVVVVAADYMETEYGFTAKEADQIAAKLRAETARQRVAGALISLDEVPPAHASNRSQQKRAALTRKARA